MEDYQKCKFVKKWNEDTPIDWWNESRIELNKIIEIYNNWQIEGFDKENSKKVIAHIEYGKQTIGTLDGGSGYLEALVNMESFVKSMIY